MSKTFVVQLRKNSLRGPIKITSNVVSITGIANGSISSNDFKDNIIGQRIYTDIDRTVTIVKPVGSPVVKSISLAYALTSNVSMINEGQAVRISLETLGVDSGARVNFTVTGVSSGDIFSEYITGTSGYFILDGAGTAYRDIIILEDNLTEGTETMTVTVDGVFPIVSTSVVINNTSSTVTGNAVLSIGGHGAELVGSYILPKAPVWLMFRITGAGGSGGSSHKDLGGSIGGRGGAGISVRGVVQLPRTDNNKILMGGVGSGGAGTNGINSPRISPGIGWSFPINNNLKNLCLGGIGGERGTEKSGAGGNGGGSSALGFVISGPGINFIVPIAAAGGGGGGGGASINGSGGAAQVGNIIPYPANTIDNLNGEHAKKSDLPMGGDGGGGGGGGGLAGFASNSKVLTSTGGTSGLVIKNNNNVLTQINWAAFEVIAADGSLDVSTVSNIVARTYGYFGSGSPGGTYSTTGYYGAQGAIAVHWTTDITAPTNWNLVPEYLEPNIISITDRTITTKIDTDAYFKFNRDGTIESSEKNGPEYWTELPHDNIGNIYQVRVTRLTGNATLISPVNGLGNSLGQWLNLSSAKEWWLKNTNGATNQANLKIEIRGMLSQTMFADVEYRLVSRSSNDTTMVNPTVGTGGSAYVKGDFTNPGVLLFKVFDQVTNGGGRDLFLNLVDSDNRSNLIPLKGDPNDWDTRAIGQWVNLNCISYDDDQIDPRATFVQLCTFIPDTNFANDVVSTWADVISQANQDLGLWNSLDPSIQDQYDPILALVAQRDAELGINTNLFGSGVTGSVLPENIGTGAGVLSQNGNPQNLDTSSVGVSLLDEANSLFTDASVVVGFGLTSGFRNPIETSDADVLLQQYRDRGGLAETPWEQNRRLDEQAKNLPAGELTGAGTRSLAPLADATLVSGDLGTYGTIQFEIHEGAPVDVNAADPGIQGLLSNRGDTGYILTGDRSIDKVRTQLETNYVKALEDTNLKVDATGLVTGREYSASAWQIIQQFEKVDLIDQFLIWYPDGTLNVAATVQWLAANDQYQGIQTWAQSQIDSIRQATEVFRDPVQWADLTNSERLLVLNQLEVAPFLDSTLFYLQESAGIKIFPDGYQPGRIFTPDELRQANDEFAAKKLALADQLAESNARENNIQTTESRNVSVSESDQVDSFDSIYFESINQSDSDWTDSLLSPPDDNFGQSLAERLGIGMPGGSVFVRAHLPGTDKSAGHMGPGDPLVLLSPDRKTIVDGIVIGNRISRQKLITLVSESGIELTLSDNTPITLEDGSYINSRDAFGYRLPVLDDAGFRWEIIIDVRDLGPGLVATIYCQNQCYAAGDFPGRYIITHNINFEKFSSTNFQREN